MKKIICQNFLIFLLFPSQLLFTQPINKDDPEIGKVGNRIIYKSEFLQRCEFNPYLGRTPNDPNDSYKYETLLTLIGEKLLAQKAEKNGLDTSVFVSVPLKYIEKMTIRDELYKNEIYKEIEIDPSELKKGIEKYFTELYTTLFLSDSKSSVDSLAILLEHDSDKRSFKSGNNISVYHQVINFGQLDNTIEDLIFNLKQNTFSNVVKFNQNWAFFFIDSIKTKYPKNQKELSNAEKDVEIILKRRTTNKFHEKFYKNFFKDKDIRANATLFKIILNRIKKLFNDRKYSTSANDNTMFVLNNRSIYEIQNEISADTLKMDFIVYQEAKIKLKDFLDELGFEGFKYSIKDSISIEQRLNARLKKYMEYELLSSEGYKLGYNYLPEVKKSVSMWKDYYLSLAMKENIYHQNHDVDSNYFYQNGFLDNQNISDSLRKFEKSQIDLYSKDPSFLKLLKETIDMADQVGIKIDKALFESIEVSYINMFVFRYYGFGGRLPAVPPTLPFTEWYNLWDLKNKVIF